MHTAGRLVPSSTAPLSVGATGLRTTHPKDFRVLPVSGFSGFSGSSGSSCSWAPLQEDHRAKISCGFVVMARRHYDSYRDMVVARCILNQKMRYAGVCYKKLGTGGLMMGRRNHRP